MNPISKYWLYRRQNYVRELIKVRTSRILDIGCGENKIFPTAIGLDVYPYSGVDKIGSAENLPFANKSFDIVTMLEVIEHLDNPEKALKEIYRVLKRNGKVIISTPNVTLVWKIIWLFWSNTIGRKWKGYHSKEFDKNGLVSLLSKYFKIIYLGIVNKWILVVVGQKIK